MTFQRVAVLAMAAGALACASSGGRPPPSATVATRTVLLADEIRVVGAATAYEAISRLRPEWLRQRGAVSMRQPAAGNLVIYVDGARYGDASSLRTLRAELVLSLEYIDGRSATTRFGTGHGGGVILVQTR